MNDPNDIPTILRRRASHLKSEDGYNDDFLRVFETAAREIETLRAAMTPDAEGTRRLVEQRHWLKDAMQTIANMVATGHADPRTSRIKSTSHNVLARIKNKEPK